MGARRLRYGVVFLLGLSAVLLLFWWVRPETGKAASLTGAPKRVLEARLTRAPYQPPPPPGNERRTRSGSASEASRQTSNPESLRITAVDQLLYGDVERAVTALEKAAGLSARDAGLQSDLAAAYLARAEEKQQPEDLIRALSAALQANRLDPALAEAAFNRALLSEKLWLRQQAIRAWKMYRELDRSSEWGTEAERHLQALEQPTLAEIWPAEKKRLAEAAAAGDTATVREIVRGAPQASREFVEEELLGVWADAQATGDHAGALRILRAAEVIGEVVLEITTDAMARDSATVIRRAAQVDPRALERLIRGLQLFRDGKRYFNALALEKSAPLMAKAQEDLAAAGSPLHGWAGFYHGVWAQRTSDYKTAFADFQRALTLNPHDYPVLVGQAEAMIGLTLNYQSQFDESLTHYNLALSQLQRAHQPQSIAINHFLIAEDLLLLGDDIAADAHLQAALPLSNQILKRRWVTTILEKAAESAHRKGQLLASLELMNEAVHAARQEGNPAMLSEAFLSRSLIHHLLSNQRAALRDLTLAESWLMKVDSKSPIYQVMEAQLLGAKGRVLLKSEPDQVIEGLGKALQDRAHTGAAVWKTPLYLERGRAYLETGHADLAEADFLSAIHAFEQRRTKISGEQLRISSFAEAREVFDEMIRLQAVFRHDPWQALRFSERARAQELLHTVTRGEQLGLQSAREIQNRLPSGIAILYYTVLEDKLLIWMLSNQHADFVEQDANAAEIKQQVKELLAAILSGATEARVTSSALYERLIAPVRRNLPPLAALVIVPDKCLHELPFAALFDGRSGRYLVEDHAVTISPSAELFLHGLQRKSLFRSLDTSRALVVGNPAFDRNRLPHLPLLPGAEREARRIAALYSHPKLLLDEAATKNSFLAIAGQYEIVHFSGHSLANEKFPFLSQLLLAPGPEPGDNGSLFAYEVYGQSFPRTRLVVLASCQSARARVSPGEGALNLARPFLAAGVPSVLASLWDIDDSGSDAFFELFHKKLKAGASPIESLHATQLECLTDRNPSLRELRTWAGLELIQGRPR